MTEDASQPKFRRRAAARPDEVLDAALELFAAQGFARTTVEQVSARAGLSKAAVYLYFPSKQALLQGLVHRAVGQAAGQAVAGMAGYRGDPRPVLAALLRQIAGVLGDPKASAIPAIILREAPHAPDIAAIYRDEVLTPILPALRGLIAQGVEGGFIRPVDPDLTIRSIIGPVLVHVLLAQVFGILPAGGLSMDRLIDNHLTILMAGLDPGKGMA